MDDVSTMLSTFSDSLYLVDDPVSLPNSVLTAKRDEFHSSFGYAIPISSRRLLSSGRQLGNWSVLQGFLADKNVPIIPSNDIDFYGEGCKYIDEGKSFVVKTARFSKKLYTPGIEHQVAEGKMVAVKLVKPFDTQEKIENVCLEILALTHPPLHAHQNIIDLIGITWTSERDLHMEPALVVEFAEYGSLDKYLNSHQLDIVAKSNICVQIADGLDMLHQCAIIHGDVKCENVLMVRGVQRCYCPKTF